MVLATALVGQVRHDQPWSSFRGPLASGVADGQNLPQLWDGAKSVNVKWKTSIPASPTQVFPICAGNNVFVTTAVSSRGNDNFKPGLYGEGTASEDRSVHRWKLYALDKNSGKVLWERTVYGRSTARETSYQSDLCQFHSCYEWKVRYCFLWLPRPSCL